MAASDSTGIEPAAALPNGQADPPLASGTASVPPPLPGAPPPAQPLRPAAPRPIPRPAAPQGATPAPAAAAAGAVPQPASRPAQPAAPRPAQPAPRPVPVAAQGGAPLRPVLVKRDPGNVSVHATAPPPEDPLKGFASRSAPPWLVSALFHAALVLVMGLVFFRREAAILLDLETRYADQLGDQLLDNSSPESSDQPEDIEQEVHVISDLEAVEDPFSAPENVEFLPNPTMAASDIPAPVVGSLFEGRTEGNKKKLLGKYGGDKTTEDAVQMGLEWLARNQNRNGSWSLVGPYPGGAGREVSPAATAMALIAFQGAGHTHTGAGPFRKNVEAGIRALLEMQSAEGAFTENVQRHDRQYAHAQATIALCELYGMTNDSTLRDAAQRAVDYCVYLQGGNGGWRYEDKEDGDVSVTGWMVIALQSAKTARLKFDPEVLYRVQEFLDTCTKGGSEYSYQANDRPTIVMTAEALLCRQFLGWSRNDPRLKEGIRTLVTQGLPHWRDRDVYYWYYGTQVLHHYGGKSWDRWNKAMAPMLVERQEKQGANRGSWNPGGADLNDYDRWGTFGGRLYVTCLSLYILEVYYRHLTPFELKQDGATKDGEKKDDPTKNDAGADGQEADLDDLDRALDDLPPKEGAAAEEDAMESDPDMEDESDSPIGADKPKKDADEDSDEADSQPAMKKSAKKSAGKSAKSTNGARQVKPPAP